MRIQAEKSKPKVSTKTSISDVSKPVYKCSTPQCHTQEPASNILCDECMRMYSSTSNIYQDEQQTTSPMSSYVSTSSSNDCRSIKSKRTEWRCDICDYAENVMDNEICTVCQCGRRPEHQESFEQMSYDQLADPSNDIVL